MSQVSRINVSEGWLYASVQGVNSSFTAGWNKSDAHKPKITQTDGASLAFLSGENIRNCSCGRSSFSARREDAKEVQISHLRSSKSERCGTKKHLVRGKQPAPTQYTLIWL